MPAKPTIFLSHITEEAEIAKIYKSEIEDKFLNMVDIFVSSDATSLRLGKKWLDEITNNLLGCVSMLIFCSPYSITRPWINFECGAGWARGIDIAPLCHSGLRPVDLPLPMSLLQGIEASDPSRITEVFQLIADKIGSRTPETKPQVIADKVRLFEAKYTQETKISRHLRKIKSISERFLSLLANVTPNVVTPIEAVPETLVERMRPSLDALEQEKLLSFNFSVLGIGFGGRSAGTFGTLTVSLDQKVVSACAALMLESDSVVPPACQ